MVFWLAIFGMVCWGIAPVFAKVGLRNVNPAAGLALRTLLAAGLVGSWVGMTGSFATLKEIPGPSWVLIGIEAILATLIGDLAYYAAIKYGEVSLVSVIMASSPLVTMLCASIFLGEQITVFRVIGSCLVMLGIVMLI
ncbi:MAG TPA: EamA family transporter [Syntrophomonadaceae bacterium]|nr:EamA family transporter [Syntrophomonadaceae bacterium]